MVIKIAGVSVGGGGYVIDETQKSNITTDARENLQQSLVNIDQVEEILAGIKKLREKMEGNDITELEEKDKEEILDTFREASAKIQEKLSFAQTNAKSVVESISDLQEIFAKSPEGDITH